MVAEREKILQDNRELKKRLKDKEKNCLTWKLK
jgi:hypothetical protein